jgi:4-aminobutyrate aminotransferase-like enzyme
MSRQATTPDGKVCLRCHGFVYSRRESNLACSCTKAQLDQFTQETHSDQKLVSGMLFHHAQSENGALQTSQRKKYTEELQKLYKEHEQLAIRNGVRSPFTSVRF